MGGFRLFYDWHGLLCFSAEKKMAGLKLNQLEKNFSQDLLKIISGLKRSKPVEVGGLF
ncbi:MAG: hypothetical protein ACLFQV_07125 [Vulcanimicrobiota bacterium]